MNRTHTLYNSDFRLFNLNREKKLKLITILIFLWILSLIFYLLPATEHDILVLFSTSRANFYFAFVWYIFTEFGLYLVEIPIIFLYYASFRIEKFRSYRLVLFLSILLISIGSLLINSFLKNYFIRPRPWMLYTDINSIYYPSGFSFPSGHAFQAFALILPPIMALINDDNYKYHPKKIALILVLFIFALLLAFSRIVVGVHFLSDVFFGIGMAILLFLIFGSLIEWLVLKNLIHQNTEKWFALFVTLILLLAII